MNKLCIVAAVLLAALAAVLSIAPNACVTKSCGVCCSQDKNPGPCCRVGTGQLNGCTPAYNGNTLSVEEEEEVQDYQDPEEAFLQGMNIDADEAETLRSMEDPMPRGGGGSSRSTSTSSSSNPCSASCTELLTYFSASRVVTDAKKSCWCSKLSSFSHSWKLDNSCVNNVAMLDRILKGVSPCDREKYEAQVVQKCAATLSNDMKACCPSLVRTATVINDRKQL